MAGRTIHNIAVTMSADTGNAIGQFENVGRAIARLNRVQQQLISKGQFSAAIDQEIKALMKKQSALLQTEKATKQLIKSQAGMGIGMGKMNQAFGQAAFAVEDFMTQIHTMGFSGAFRAAGNNLSMMGHILGGPLIGGLVGVGSILGGIWLDKWFKTEKATEKATKKLEQYLEVLKEVHDIEDKNIKLKRDLSDIGNIEKSETAEQSLDELKKSIEDTERELKKLNEQRKTLTKGLNEQIGPMGLMKAFTDIGRSDVKGEFSRVFASFKDAPEDARENIKQAIDKFNSILQTEIFLNRDKINLELEMTGLSGGVPHSKTLDALKEQRDAAIAVLQPILDQKEFLDDIANKKIEIAKLEKALAKDVSDFEARERAAAKKAEDLRFQERSENHSRMLEKFRKMGMSADERRLEDIRAQFRDINKELSDHVKGTDFPVPGLGTFAGDAAQAAKERILEQEIEAIKGRADKPVLPKGEAILGNAVAEQIATAKAAARAQVDAARAEDKDVKREQLLKVLEEMLRSLRSNKILATQVGS